jgi:hypothetical protein
MKSFILALFLTTSACAETIILPVQDLLFEHQNYLSPKFNLGSALHGRVEVGQPPKMNRKTRKELENALIYLLEDEYPDLQSLRIWQGNVIIQLKDNK